MFDSLATAFVAWGYEVTFLELGAVITAFLGIGLAIRGTRWAWPFYFLSSLLYGWLLWEFALYGTAALQLVFMASAIWGWFGWGPKGIAPTTLSPRSRLIIVAGGAVAWLALVPVLAAIGDPAPWPDTFVFVFSVIAQVLMVREFAEAWLMWSVVNVVGVALYATQSLWFTSLFYAVLIIMAIVGWRSWQARRAPLSESAIPVTA